MGSRSDSVTRAAEERSADTDVSAGYPRRESGSDARRQAHRQYSPGIGLIARLADHWSAYRPRRTTVLSFSILLLGTLLIWSYPAWGGFASGRLSVGGDSASYAFYMSWNLHALTHFENPFFTPFLYAPYGEDLSNGITLPAAGLLLAPITALWGGTASYNVALLLAIFMGGAAVFLLTRELTGSGLAGTVAGVLMLTSPYNVSHGIGHLNLMFVFGLPYLAYLLVRLLNKDINIRWTIAGVAATFALTVGTSTELVVTESLFAAFALAVTLLVVGRELRLRLLHACGPLITGIVIGAVLASPVFVVALRHGTPKIPASWAGHFSTDLSNLIAPTALTFFGHITSVSATWTSSVAENSAYVPIPLLVLLLAYAAVRRSRLVIGSLAFAVIALILSLGPRLIFEGHRSISMPWALAAHVPALDSVLPNRFTVWMFVSLLIVLADALGRPGVLRWLSLAVAAISLVLLLPNLPGLQYPVNVTVAGFVSSGDIKKEVGQGENVLVLPSGQNGPGMLWLTETDFYFKTPTGNGGGGAVPEGLKTPVAQAMFLNKLDYDYRTQLPPYLASLSIHTVLVPASFPAWKAVMDAAFRVEPHRIDDVWVYRLP